jgi:hypothetical protein
VTVQDGPCSDWPVYWSADIAAFSPAVTGQAVTMASHLLWALSGRQFGTCSVTLRPCRRSCFEPWPGGWYAYPWSSYGALLASSAGDLGYWFPLSCGACASASGCSCSYVPEAYLPAPVNDVTQVKVDGAVLASSAYRLDNNRILVRTDGSDWPSCNDLTKDDTRAGTWSVTFDVGKPVPVSGQVAMGEMAYEIAKAIDGDPDTCRLPQQVTALARQGVSVSFPPLQDLLAEGRTGLWLVDMFLESANPNRLDHRSRVYSVDRPQVRRTST